MSTQDQPDSPPKLHQKLEPKRIALRPVTIILFLTVNLVVLMILGGPYLAARYQLPFDLPWDPSNGLQTSATRETEEPVGIVTQTPTSTRGAILPTSLPAKVETLPEVTVDPDLWEQGLIVLSMQDGLDTHLFAYQPLAGVDGSVLPLTRLTSGSWDDINPVPQPKSRAIDLCL